MLQKIELIGYIVADAVAKTTNDGKEFAAFKLAVNDNSSSSEERKVTFYDVCLAKTGVLPHLLKGRLVYVSGKISVSAALKDSKAYANITVSARDVELLGGGKQTS